MQPLRVRAINGAVADSDQDVAVTQADPNSSLVTVSGTIADGDYTFNIEPLGGDPIPVTHTADVSGASDDADDIRAGWAGTTITGTSLEPYVSSIAATATTGQVRVTFLTGAPPCRLSVEDTPNDPTSSIAIGTDDCFPNVFRVPQTEHNKLAILFVPVSYAVDAVTNIFGTGLPDDNAMTVSFELIPVLNRAVGLDSRTYRYTGTLPSDYRYHATEVTGHVLELPYIASDVFPGLYHLRISATANTPTGYEGLEAYVIWY